MIGKTISHYKILEKLGEGGMGVVYKAEDTKLERTVALKFLSLTSIGDEEKKRFKREAKAAASLNHPNIATIHAIDEVDDQTFIAMEYIEGKSVEEIVGADDGKPMSIEELICMLLTSAPEMFSQRAIRRKSLQEITFCLHVGGSIFTPMAIASL